MSDDLVSRLRLRIRQEEGDAPFMTATPPTFLYREAADTIERLMRERNEADRAFRHWLGKANSFEHELCEAVMNNVHEQGKARTRIAKLKNACGEALDYFNKAGLDEEADAIRKALEDKGP